MQKRSELYVISEPETEAPAVSNVIPIGASAAAPPPPRDHSWRDLMRRMQKGTPPQKPRS